MVIEVIRISLQNIQHGKRYDRPGYVCVCDLCGAKWTYVEMPVKPNRGFMLPSNAYCPNCGEGVSLERADSSMPWAIDRIALL